MATTGREWRQRHSLTHREGWGEVGAINHQPSTINLSGDFIPSSQRWLALANPAAAINTRDSQPGDLRTGPQVADQLLTRLPRFCVGAEGLHPPFACHPPADPEERIRLGHSPVLFPFDPLDFP
ncbi:MAG: hypothetical protein FJ387_19865 [Verrucomicrobia bacterium]|nr:hypothetical protein [Verrucomicrobiota bacterium]